MVRLILRGWRRKWVLVRRRLCSACRKEIGLRNGGFNLRLSITLFKQGDGSREGLGREVGASGVVVEPGKSAGGNGLKIWATHLLELEVCFHQILLCEFWLMQVYVSSAQVSLRVRLCKGISRAPRCLEAP